MHNRKHNEFMLGKEGIKRVLSMSKLLGLDCPKTTNSVYIENESEIKELVLARGLVSYRIEDKGQRFEVPGLELCPSIFLATIRNLKQKHNNIKLGVME